MDWPVANGCFELCMPAPTYGHTALHDTTLTQWLILVLSPNLLIAVSTAAVRSGDSD